MRTTSPYMEFYKEILNMKTDFGEVGVEEDVLGVDQVEVYFLEGGGNGGATGLVKIDLETISKLVFQLVRKQATELPSRTFGGLKGPNVIFSLTTMGSDVEVNNSRSDGFCLKMRRQEENPQNEETDRTITSRSGEEERGQWARAIDDGSEREPRGASQYSQGDQEDSGDGQPNFQAKSEDGQEKIKAQEKLLEIVNKATEVIEHSRRAQNGRSAKVVRGFGANAVFEPAGIYLHDEVSIYVPESLLRFAPVVKTITSYMGGFSWPHIFTTLFGAGSSTLPCSAKDLEQVLLEFDERIPLIKDAAQTKIAISRLRRDAIVSVSCILSQKDKYAEALEVEYLVEELVDIYGRALPHVQASSQTTDSQSQGVLLAELEQIQNSLARIKREAVSNIEARLGEKNNLAFWGAMLNHLGTVSNSIWKAVTSKEALEKKEKQWENMKAEDAEREFYWWLAGAAFLQIGTFTAGYSYSEVVYMQQEDARLDCRSESIMQESLEKYSLVHNPRELLRVTGTRRGAERYLEDFQRKMILDNFCVLREEEGVPLKATIDQYISIAYSVLDLE